MLAILLLPWANPKPSKTICFGTQKPALVDFQASFKKTHIFLCVFFFGGGMKTTRGFDAYLVDRLDAGDQVLHPRLVWK